METFTKLFGSLLVFVYHCFDRIVIRGYLSGLSRPEQVVYFFREVVGVPVVDKTVLLSGPATIRSGWKLTPVITRFPSNGPKRTFARKITCCLRCVGW